jgi:hypothetical protein
VKALDAMSWDELREYMRRLSRAVEDVLPPGPSKHGKCDFALVLATEGGKTHYVTNSRKRIRKAIRKTAARMSRSRPGRLAVSKPPYAG